MNKRILINTISNVSYKQVIILLITGVLVSIALLAVSPYYKPIAGRDSTVFQYIGWKINQGNIPYKDIWDHKPPIIFFINALALRLFNNSSWGIWIFEWFNLFLSGIISFQLLKKFFGELISGIVTILWLLCIPKLISEGNLTTEFALSLQFLSMHLFLFAEKKRHKKTTYFCIGILSGLSFFLKQTLIGILITIILTLIFYQIHVKKWENVVGIFFLVLSGFLLVTILIILYFAVNGNLFDFWKDAFLYNFVYIKTDIYSKYLSIKRGIDLLTTTGVIIFAFIGYFVVFSIVMLNKSKRFGFLKDNNPFNIKLMCYVLLNLPIEIALSTISGRVFPHYYLSWIPIMTLLAGYGLYQIGRLLDDPNISERNKNLIVTVTSLSLPVLVLISGYYSSFPPFLKIDNSRDQNSINVINYITQNTNEKDTVLVLGAETGINFYSKRSSPTRYVYQYPLIKKNYKTFEMLDEFSADIDEKKPKIIIDATKSNPAYTMGMGGGIENVYDSSPFFDTLRNNSFIKTNCHNTRKYDDWIIYLCLSQ